MTWFSKLFGRETSPPAQTPIEPLVPVMTVDVPPQAGGVALYGDQIMRKEWAEGLIQAQNIPINPHLPCIQSEAETRPRTPQEIADRLLALIIVAVKGEGLDQENVEAFIAARNAHSLFSPAERAFIENPTPSNHDRAQFAWRYECAWVMFWALNFVDGGLSFPDDICDVPTLVQTVRDTPDLSQFGARSTNDMLNEADIIYRLHWAERQAHIDGLSAPGGMEAGVIWERHHALNWLIGYEAESWDDVSTHT